MTDIEILRRLGLALAIGLLIGLERGWHRRLAAEGERVAGVRTFALVGLLGGVAGWLVPVATPFFLVGVLLALAALLAVSYLSTLQREGDAGLTTEIALLLVFVLGAASALGEMVPAAAAGVVCALLLSLKSRLHGWIARIEGAELSALLKLALISVVILPVMPDQGFGPGGVLNPHELWWAVVVVAGLSFLGYIAIRAGGAELGMLMAGFFGGLASSTSTTLALARVASAQPAFSAQAAAGALVSGSVTFLRILVLTAIFRHSLFLALALPMGVMAGVGLFGAAGLHLLSRRRERQSGGVGDLANPLELGTALTFGAVLGVILLGVHYLRAWLGDAGVYAAAALSGVTDVDALTISVSRLVGPDLAVFSGAVAIFIAVSVNSVVKSGISLFAGSLAMGLRVLPVYLAAILCGGVALAFSQSAFGALP